MDKPSSAVTPLDMNNIQFGDMRIAAMDMSALEQACAAVTQQTNALVIQALEARYNHLSSAKHPQRFNTFLLFLNQKDFQNALYVSAQYIPFEGAIASQLTPANYLYLLERALTEKKWRFAKMLFQSQPTALAKDPEGFNLQGKEFADVAQSYGYRQKTVQIHTDVQIGLYDTDNSPQQLSSDIDKTLSQNSLEDLITVYNKNNKTDAIAHPSKFIDWLIRTGQLNILEFIFSQGAYIERYLPNISQDDIKVLAPYCSRRYPNMTQMMVGLSVVYQWPEAFVRILSNPMVGSSVHMTHPNTVKLLTQLLRKAVSDGKYEVAHTIWQKIKSDHKNALKGIASVEEFALRNNSYKLLVITAKNHPKNRLWKTQPGRSLTGALHAACLAMDLKSADILYKAMVSSNQELQKENLTFDQFLVKNGYYDQVQKYVKQGFSRKSTSINGYELPLDLQTSEMRRAYANLVVKAILEKGKDSPVVRDLIQSAQEYALTPQQKQFLIQQEGMKVDPCIIWKKLSKWDDTFGILTETIGSESEITQAFMQGAAGRAYAQTLYLAYRNDCKEQGRPDRSFLEILSRNPDAVVQLITLPKDGHLARMSYEIQAYNDLKKLPKNHPIVLRVTQASVQAENFTALAELYRGTRDSDFGFLTTTILDLYQNHQFDLAEALYNQTLAQYPQVFSESEKNYSDFLAWNHMGLSLKESRENSIIRAMIAEDMVQAENLYKKYCREFPIKRQKSFLQIIAASPVALDKLVTLSSVENPPILVYEAYTQFKMQPQAENSMGISLERVLCNGIARAAINNDALLAERLYEKYCAEFPATPERTFLEVVAGSPDALTSLFRIAKSVNPTPLFTQAYQDFQNLPQEFFRGMARQCIQAHRLDVLEAIYDEQIQAHFQEQNETSFWGGYISVLLRDGEIDLAKKLYDLACEEASTTMFDAPDIAANIEATRKARSPKAIVEAFLENNKERAQILYRAYCDYCTKMGQNPKSFLEVLATNPKAIEKLVEDQSQLVVKEIQEDIARSEAEYQSKLYSTDITSTEVMHQDNAPSFSLEKEAYTQIPILPIRTLRNILRNIVKTKNFILLKNLYNQAGWQESNGFWPSLIYNMHIDGETHLAQELYKLIKENSRLDIPGFGETYNDLIANGEHLSHSIEPQRSNNKTLRLEQKEREKETLALAKYSVLEKALLQARPLSRAHHVCDTRVALRNQMDALFQIGDVDGALNLYQEYGDSLEPRDKRGLFYYIAYCHQGDILAQTRLATMWLAAAKISDSELYAKINSSKVQEYHAVLENLLLSGQMQTALQLYNNTTVHGKIPLFAKYALQHLVQQKEGYTRPELEIIAKLLEECPEEILPKRFAQSTYEALLVISCENGYKKSTAALYEQTAFPKQYSYADYILRYGYSTQLLIEAPVIAIDVFRPLHEACTEVPFDLNAIQKVYADIRRDVRSPSTLIDFLAEHDYTSVLYAYGKQSDPSAEWVSELPLTDYEQLLDMAALEDNLDVALRAYARLHNLDIHNSQTSRDFLNFCLDRTPMYVTAFVAAQKNKNFEPHFTANLKKKIREKMHTAIDRGLGVEAHALYEMLPANDPPYFLEYVMRRAIAQDMSSGRICFIIQYLRESNESKSDQIDPALIIRVMQSVFSLDNHWTDDQKYQIVEALKKYWLRREGIGLEGTESAASQSRQREENWTSILHTGSDQYLRNASVNYSKDRTPDRLCRALNLFSNQQYLISGHRESLINSILTDIFYQRTWTQQEKDTAIKDLQKFASAQGLKSWRPRQNNVTRREIGPVSFRDLTWQGRIAMIVQTFTAVATRRPATSFLILLGIGAATVMTSGLAGLAIMAIAGGILAGIMIYYDVRVAPYNTLVKRKPALPTAFIKHADSVVPKSDLTHDGDMAPDYSPVFLDEVSQEPLNSNPILRSVLPPLQSATSIPILRDMQRSIDRIATIHALCEPTLLQASWRANQAIPLAKILEGLPDITRAWLVVSIVFARIQETRTSIEEQKSMMQYYIAHCGVSRELLKECCTCFLQEHQDISILSLLDSEIAPSLPVKSEFVPPMFDQPVNLEQSYRDCQMYFLEWAQIDRALDRLFQSENKVSLEDRADRIVGLIEHNMADEKDKPTSLLWNVQNLLQQPKYQGLNYKAIRDASLKRAQQRVESYVPLTSAPSSPKTVVRSPTPELQSLDSATIVSNVYKGQGAQAWMSYSAVHSEQPASVRARAFMEIVIEAGIANPHREVAQFVSDFLTKNDYLPAVERKALTLELQPLLVRYQSSPHKTDLRQDTTEIPQVMHIEPQPGITGRSLDDSSIPHVRPSLMVSSVPRPATYDTDIAPLIQRAESQSQPNSPVAWQEAWEQYQLYNPTLTDREKIVGFFAQAISLQAVNVICAFHTYILEQQSGSFTEGTQALMDIQPRLKAFSEELSRMQANRAASAIHDMLITDLTVTPQRPRALSASDIDSLGQAKSLYADSSKNKAASFSLRLNKPGANSS